MLAFEVILFSFCLLCGAFFSGIETGIISVHRLRLRHLAEDEEDESSKIIEMFLDDTDRLFGTTLSGNNISNVIVAVIGARFGARFGVYFNCPYAEFVAGLLTALLVLLVAEYLPKAWFQADPIDRCRPLAGVLWKCSLLLKPLSDFFTKVVVFLFPKTSGEESGRKVIVTREEIDILAKESAEHGNLSPRQRIMIRRVVDLAGKTALKVMIPREEVVSIDSSASATEFLELSRASGFTRLPVFDRARGVYVGIANLFDVLAATPERYEENIARFMRPVQFLRDNTPLTEILPRLRHSRQPLALVSDSKSDVLGLVTTQNVLSLIIGADMKG